MAEPHRTYFYSVFHWTRGPESTAARLVALRAKGVTALEFGSLPRWEAGLDDLVRSTAGPLLLHNYFPPPETKFALNLASADEKVRVASLELVVHALSLSGDVGARAYAVHAGFVADPLGFEGTSFVFPPVSPYEAALAYSRFVDAIRDLIPIATHHGVRLLVENNSCPARWRGFPLICTPDEAGRFLADVGPDVGLLLDTGHLRVSARTYGFEPLEFAEAHRARILGLHLHDNDGVSDTHGLMREGGLALTVASECSEARWVTVESKCATLSAVSQQLEIARRAFGDRIGA